MHLSESTTLEYKREYTPEINKSIVAFANTNGGTLYIGIADDGGVVGVRNVDSVLLIVSNSIREAIKPDVTLFTDYHTEEIDGKTAIDYCSKRYSKAETNLKAKRLKTFCEKFSSQMAIHASMADYRQEDWLLNLPLWAVERRKRD